MITRDNPDSNGIWELSANKSDNIYRDIDLNKVPKALMYKRR